MTPEEKFEKLREIVASNAGTEPGKIVRETRFFDLTLDSLDFMNLIKEVEEAFGVRIDEKGILDSNRVSDLCDLVGA